MPVPLLPYFPDNGIHLAGLGVLSVVAAIKDNLIRTLECIIGIWCIPLSCQCIPILCAYNMESRDINCPSNRCPDNIPLIAVNHIFKSKKVDETKDNHGATSTFLIIYFSTISASAEFVFTDSIPFMQPAN